MQFDKTVADFSSLGSELLRLSGEKHDLEERIVDGLEDMRIQRTELAKIQSSVAERGLNRGKLTFAIQEMQQKSDRIEKKNEDLEYLSLHVNKQTDTLERIFVKNEAVESQKVVTDTDQHYESKKRSLTERLKLVQTQSKSIKKQEDNAEILLRSLNCQIKTLRANKKLLTEKLSA